MKKTIKNGNSNVVAFIIKYEHRKKPCSRCWVQLSISSFTSIFFLITFFQKYPNIQSFDQGFEDKYYNDINIIGITEVLMNIVSYHGFQKDNTPTAILTRQRNLVS